MKNNWLLKSGVLYWIVFGFLLIIIGVNLKRYFYRPSDASTSYTFANTDVVVVNPVVTLGKNKRGSNVEAHFQLVNTGKTPLVIREIVVDCHCTKPSYNPTPVMAGDTTVIKVKYDSNIQGFFQKKLFVKMNSVNSPVILIFRGEVI